MPLIHSGRAQLHTTGRGLVFVACVWMQLQLAGADVLVEAHRGDSANAPENTLESIQYAAGAADLSEMDVRVTADGQLVLMHDASIRRTTNGSGGVRRRSLAELQSLDAGSWFSNDFVGALVPTLEQAIDTSIGLGIEPLIERKAGSAHSYHDEFMRLNLDESDFRVISFNRRFISDLDALNADYQLGILGSGRITEAKLNRLASQGADFISWRHTSVRSPSIVELVHELGMELHVWTVNNPARMQQLIDLGVDGITTDRPHVLRDLATNPNLMLAPLDQGLLAAAVALDHAPVAAAVPEPRSAPLLACGCLLWIARRRKSYGA